MSDNVLIRCPRTIAEYQSCQNTQKAAWGITDDALIIPIATMVGAQYHGGLVLAAFNSSTTCVGFNFAFLGVIDQQIGLYSQITGVLPDYQGRGIGRALKYAQRSAARQRGIPTIAWAFDPLQLHNAHFNCHILGATAHQIIPDMYGTRSDRLNPQNPTDRLIATWETNPVPRSTPSVYDLDQSTPLITLDHGLPAALQPPANPGLSHIKIPSDITRIRLEQPALAAAWQQAVRAAFQQAFALHLHVVGFQKTTGGGYYVLHYPDTTA